MSRHIDWILDNLYLFRKFVTSVQVFMSLKLYGIENVTFEDIKKQKYSNRHHRNLNFGATSDSAEILITARECLKKSEDRRTAVADKCKVLLTVSSLLFSIIGIFLPRYIDTNATLSIPLLVAVVAALLNTIMLLLAFFDIGNTMEISIDQEIVELDSAKLKQELINSYLMCQMDCDSRTDYLVDVYKAARFFFLSALNTVLILIIYSMLLHYNNAREITQEFREDKALIGILCKQKSDQEGAGTVNTDEIAKWIIDDQQLMKYIHEIEERSTHLDFRDQKTSNFDASPRPTTIKDTMN